MMPYLPVRSQQKRLRHSELSRFKALPKCHRPGGGTPKLGFRSGPSPPSQAMWEFEECYSLTFQLAQATITEEQADELVDDL
jgi:hypothetical protein